MKFYKVHKETGKRKRFAYGISVDQVEYEETKCVVCGVERNRIINEPDIHNIALSNSHFSDFCGYYGRIPFVLISENAQSIFKIQKIIGYGLSPINVISLNDLSSETKKWLRSEGDPVNNFASAPLSYSALEITGQAELHEKSGVKVVVCSACGFANITLMNGESPRFIKEKSWDGSDLFLVPFFPALIFCTERFVGIYNNYKLTGLDFEEVEGI